MPSLRMCAFFFFNDTATTEIYTLSLHDALPISHGLERLHDVRLVRAPEESRRPAVVPGGNGELGRSEEHTSELQSPCNLVCRLLLEKKQSYQWILLPRSQAFLSTFFDHHSHTSQ